jgi:hypothetical protein
MIPATARLMVMALLIGATASASAAALSHDLTSDAGSSPVAAPSTGTGTVIDDPTSAEGAAAPLKVCPEDFTVETQCRPIVGTPHSYPRPCI